MSQEKLDHVVAGAIFDFMGWLTTRQEKLVLSSADDAAPAAEAVKEFLTMRGVAQDCEPMIHDWPARCSMVGNTDATEMFPDYWAAWKAATDAALERAAEVCVDISAHQLTFQQRKSAATCAEAIRALKDEK
jgi:hypothetical protein